jgi:predicted ATPase/serine phosphatase RsbU (regulator of sigma subunit)/tRNA A-37 threonylcarbamoyl transferase component Bud32
MFALPHYQILTPIYESANSLVYRAIRETDNQPVILKVLKQDYPTPEELTRYRQEYDITCHLANVGGITNVYSLEKHHNTLVMIIEDFGGHSLKELLTERSLSLNEFFTVACHVAQILGQIHQHNIIHKDINPANIVWNPKTATIKMIDFGISTQLSRQHLTLKNPNVLEGTLAYLSPEQTGRMNRALDYRTDFYSLGATFYELLTGTVPFEASDAMELVHCHLAKHPPSPNKINSDIPPSLSDIIMKLLAKTAEERYQSAWGLKADLELCQANLTRGKIEPFILAQQDLSDRFQIPEKLYGRENEIKTLLNAFERVANSSQAGGSEMMLVAGYSGIGKSVLVKEIYKSLTEKRGYFIAGKFDQLQRNIPYTALLSAFSELVQQLLTETEQALRQWKDKLLKAVGSNGQVIIDVIPEIELIIGKQSPVPELGATEAQNRFNMLFQNMIRVFCQPEHPLVLFLDDLQWVDSATLKLLKVIMTDSETKALFIIGAFRDNEVDENHPFIMTLESLRQENVKINQITLKPLIFEDIKQLITESLHQKEVDSLTNLVMRKTGGNPFFVNQFLQTLYEEEMLTLQKFDLSTSTTVQYGWQWNIAEIEAMNITDNVVDLMLAKLKKLPESSQAVLRLGACIGNHFDLYILSVIFESSVKETFQAIMPVLTEGFILPISDLETSNNAIDNVPDLDFVSQVAIHHFRFLHDRVQQAAYALIDEKQKQTVHLQIARLLLKNTRNEELEHNLFDIVEHFNPNLELVENSVEKKEIARLNFMAGKKAKAAMAYEAAVNYLNVALECLLVESWKTDYELTLQLHLTMIEAQYLNLQFEQATFLVEVVLQNATNLLDKVTVYENQIFFFGAQNKMQEAINTGLQALQMLNIPLSKFPPKNIDFEQCYNLPQMLDPEKQLALKILMNMITPAYVVSPDLLTSLVYTMVILSMQYGNAPQSAFAYTLYGMFLCGELENIHKGYRAGQLALKLLDKFNAEKLKPIVTENFDSCVRHWKEHFYYSSQSYQKSIQNGLEIGDVKIACHNAMHYSVSNFLIGENLENVHHIYLKYIDLMLKNKQEWNLVYTQVWVQIALNLQNKSQNRLRLIGDFFNEIESIPEFIKTNNGVSLLCVYLGKEQLAYLFKNNQLALEQANQADQYINYVPGMILNALHNFYDSLIHLAAYPNADELTRQEYLQKVVDNQKKMQIWAHHAPMNYQHKYDLVEAEKARILGQIEAIDLYEQAIEGARENRYIQEEALAYELAAEFYQARGMEKFAQTYMKEAHYRYQQWGAFAKVEDLEARYPQFLMKKITREMQTQIQTKSTIAMINMHSTSNQNTSSWLDMNSLMKASQTLSGEIVLSLLLDKMMHIVIENAGAEKGFLLLPENEHWFIEAQYIESYDVTVLQSLPLQDSQLLSVNIIQYVARTKEDVVLHDATEAGRFTRDPYIVKQQPKSVLCAPLINQGKLTGILYLENNLTTGAFTKDRLDVLHVLSSQVAISIENALLYRTLEQKVEQRTAQLAEANEEITALNSQLKSENLRMSAELDVSRRLQKMLLPTDKEINQIKGLEIAGFMEPADEVGGDYYDVLEHNGHVLMGIGDVTGHGLESGALAIMVQSAVRTLLAYDEKTQPVKFLKALNEMVYNNMIRMRAEKSLTLSLLDYQDGQLHLSGQHEDIIVVREGKAELIDTFDLGFPIGLEPDIAEFVSASEISLNAGDLVVLYTDGITEAENLSQEYYGIERLIAVIEQNWQQSTMLIKEAIIDDVRHFIGEQKVFDDITLLVFKQK